MAKSSTRPSKRARNTDTGVKLLDLARDVTTQVIKKQDPGVDIPTPALSNAECSEKRGIITMGDAMQRRSFFNLGMAKKFMQTMLIASGCKELADQRKSTSIRDMYYHTKHTIAGT